MQYAEDLDSSLSQCVFQTSHVGMTQLCCDKYSSYRRVPYIYTTKYGFRKNKSLNNMIKKVV